MDYKKDSILVSISLAGGEIEETAENRGITEVASLAVNEAATHRLNSGAIRDLMTGKNIGVSGGSAGDSLMIYVTGSPKDLEAGLQEAYALLTDGLIEETAFKNWKLSTLQGIEQREKMPQAKATEAREDLLSGGDPRRAPLSKANVEALSAAKAQAWFERLRASAPIEVAVVGDMRIEAVRPLIEKYLGSLPARARSADYLGKLRFLHRLPGPLSRQVEVGTVTPQAIAIAGFASCDGKNAADSRALALAGNILTSKLIKRVREDLSLVYSISANNTPAWIYQDGGRFGSGAPCDPANAPKVVDEIMRMFKEFSAAGPTDEELANGKKQIANHLDESMREPSYWWGILGSYDLQGHDLGEEKRVKEAFASLTKEQVQQVFQKYFTPARTYQVIAVPVKPKG
jgi:zinc protease